MSTALAVRSEDLKIMKLLICGSRAITDYDLLLEALKESGFNPTSLISGGSRGVDTLAEQYAAETGLPIQISKPDYARYRGKHASIIRNCEMVMECDAVLAVWNEISRGTRFTFEYAMKKNKPVYIKAVARNQPEEN
jgi:nucleoside 2-deoxyribosyltransferase